MTIATEEKQLIGIAKIQADTFIQSRTGIDDKTVEAYAEDMAAGAKFPPLDVFHDGAHYWLADGFHRLEAYRLCGRTKVPVTKHDGTRRDALQFSLGANTAHGLRRTNADKRACVEKVLHDEEWSQWSDRKIAKLCGVSDKTVGAVREKLSAEFPQIAQKETRRVERKGTTYRQKRRTGKPHKDAQESPMLPEQQEEEAMNWQSMNWQRPCKGLVYAGDAIEVLKRIAPNDVERHSAFMKVRRWMDKNEKIARGIGVTQMLQ